MPNRKSWEKWKNELKEGRDYTGKLKTQERLGKRENSKKSDLIKQRKSERKDAKQKKLEKWKKEEKEEGRN